MPWASRIPASTSRIRRRAWRWTAGTSAPCPRVPARSQCTTRPSVPAPPHVYKAPAGKASPKRPLSLGRPDRRQAPRPQRVRQTGAAGAKDSTTPPTRSLAVESTATQYSGTKAITRTTNRRGRRHHTPGHHGRAAPQPNQRRTQTQTQPAPHNLSANPDARSTRVAMAWRRTGSEPKMVTRWRARVTPV